ncbi:MAG TPA: CVNH domain-containing protein, partial [Dongiaceae bacterium]
MLPVDCDGDIANNNGQLRCMGLTPSNQPPFGSYQLSCNGIYMTGPILHASCLNRNGRAWETTLNVLGCKGDIANQNGQLSCQGIANQLPAGSYQQSCNGAYMTGPILRAKCRDQSGRMVQAELNVLGCRQDIANMNGYLTCQGPGYGSIIVFAGIGWQGQSRTIQYAIPDLQAIGFNNMIQSIAIAQGTWEFCTAPYFSGRCERLNHGVANLNKMGLGSQISSIRPLR